jgi:hypothetical protein
MNYISLDALSAQRNKGGYTSWVSDMGVQWDFRPNCGHARPKMPVKAIGRGPIMPWPPSDYVPEDAVEKVPSHRCLKCRHRWLVGDYLYVCRDCMMEVPVGQNVPVIGVGEERSARLKRDKSEAKKRALEMKHKQLSARPAHLRLFYDFDAPIWIHCTGEGDFNECLSPPSEEDEGVVESIKGAVHALSREMSSYIRGVDVRPGPREFQRLLNISGVWAHGLPLPYFANASPYYSRFSGMEHLMIFNFLLWVQGKMKNKDFVSALEDVKRKIKQPSPASRGPSSGG